MLPQLTLTSTVYIGGKKSQFIGEPHPHRGRCLAGFASERALVSSAGRASSARGDIDAPIRGRKCLADIGPATIETLRGCP